MNKNFLGNFLFVIFLLIISSIFWYRSFSNSHPDFNILFHEKTLKEACDNKNYQACYELAKLYEEGKKIKQDYKKAKEFYEVACDNKIYKACSNMCYLYSYGFGVEKNYKKAGEFCEISCEKAKDYKDYNACYGMGIFYSSGTESIKQDYKKARKIYEEACNNKIYKACSNLAVFYVNAYGVEKNYKKAKELFELACDNKVYRACGALSNLYLTNKYTEINLNYLKKSRKFCERACKKKKIAEACKATQDLSLIK